MTEPVHEGPSLMTQAARLYFDRQLSKVEIAAALGISRFRVARLIAQALESGLVRIEYRDAPSSDRALAGAIEERFGLDLCVVAGGSSDLGDVARLAASIVDDLVGPDDVVGIAWGSTLAAVVAAMPSRSDPSISVVQLAGSSINSGRTQDPAEIARLLAERWGASHQPLFAPAFVDTPTLREALLRQPDLVATTSMFGRLTMAILGVGAFGTSPDEPRRCRFSHQQWRRRRSPALSRHGGRRIPRDGSLVARDVHLGRWAQGRAARRRRRGRFGKGTGHLRRAPKRDRPDPRH